MKLNYIKYFIVTTIIVLTFNIRINASLSTHPEIIKDTIYVGGNETSILHITNSTSTLGYDLSSDAAWVSFSSSSGYINAGDTVSIIVYYDILNLQSGTNTANIFIGDPHHGPITIPVEVYVESTTDVKEDYSSNSPSSISLMQNYPNPFNPSTRINYSIPETQKVIIKVYNLLGNEIMTLVDGEKQKGSYSLDLDLRNYGSGVYFYTIETPIFYETRKMILTK